MGIPSREAVGETRTVPIWRTWLSSIGGLGQPQLDAKHAKTLVMPDDVRRQVRDILIRSVAISVVALALDLVVGQGIRRDLTPGISEAVRAGIVRNSLIFFSPMLALLLAATSFAVTGLNPYGNPALVLLYRWYRMAWWERPFLVVGRTNPLYRSLVLGLGLIGSLAVLAASESLKLSHNDLPALAFVAVLMVLLIANLLSFILWVVSLRRPGDVVRLTYLAGMDVLRHIGNLKKRGRRPTKRRWPEWTSVYPSRFQEQEEIRQCVWALTDVAVASLQNRRREAAKLATATLGQLDKDARSTSLPDSWEILAGPAGEEVHPDWLQELFVDAFESIVVAAADLHYLSVGSDAADRLHAVGVHIATDKKSWPGRTCVFERIIRAFQSCIDECINEKEYDLRDHLLKGFKEVVVNAAANCELHEAVVLGLREGIVRMLSRCVVINDIPSLRAAQACFHETLKSLNATEDVTKATLKGITDDIAYAIFNLGATAFASRVYGTAAALTDFAALKFDPNGERLTALLRNAERLTAAAAVRKNPYTSDRLPAYMSDQLPAYVIQGPEYFQRFLLMVAGRAESIHRRRCWSPNSLREARKYWVGLEDADRQAEVTIQRMSSAVGYAPDEVTKWVKCVKKLAS